MSGIVIDTRVASTSPQSFQVRLPAVVRGTVWGYETKITQRTEDSARAYEKAASSYREIAAEIFPNADSLVNATRERQTAANALLINGAKDICGENSPLVDLLNTVLTTDAARSLFELVTPLVEEDASQNPEKTSMQRCIDILGTIFDRLPESASLFQNEQNLPFKQYLYENLIQPFISGTNNTAESIVKYFLAPEHNFFPEPTSPIISGQLIVNKQQ